VGFFPDASSFTFLLYSSLAQHSYVGAAIILASGSRGCSTFSIQFVFCLQFFYLIKPLIFNSVYICT